MNLPKQILILANAIHKSGGTLWLVGGSVRDAYIGLEPKDWDIEVYGLEAKALKNIILQLGRAKWVGKSFSIFKSQIQGMSLDIAIPMTNGKTTPNITVIDAAKRRDLTINAIAYDPISKRHMDPYGGREDIEAKKLHYVHPHTFAMDPLRILRVARFAGQFGFTPTQELQRLCSQLSIMEVATERIQQEIHAIWLKSTHPSEALRFLSAIKCMTSRFPQWTYLCTEECYKRVDRAVNHKQGSSGIDIAMIWTSAMAEMPIAHGEMLLDALNIKKFDGVDMRSRILNGMKNWRRLLSAKTDADLFRLSDMIEMDYLIRLSECICGKSLYTQRNKVRALGIAKQAPPHLLRGQELFDIGYRGPDIGKALSMVRDLQLEGLILSKEEALIHIRSHLK